MINIFRVSLIITTAWGVLLLNKGSRFGGFIFLFFLLVLWLCALIRVQIHFSLLYVFLAACVLLAIKTKSMILFYIFFEASAIPILLIIFIYGYQPEKLHATLFLLLYTVIRSLPLLLFILVSRSSLSMTARMVSIPMTLAFIVKTPIYLLHTWLPKAHVEAPVGGSMVLAGVLLKLGSYGLLIFLPFIKMNILLSFYYGMALLGSIIGSLICIRIGDIKLLIAYSSVVHIGVVRIGFIRGSELGYVCGLLMVMGHGLCSPFLFAVAFWLYENSHSRLFVNLNCAIPLAISMLMRLVALNIGVPPRLSLWSEVFISISVLSRKRYLFPSLLLFFFLGISYNLFLYISCRHNKTPKNIVGIRTQRIYPFIQTVCLSYCSFFVLDIFGLFSDVTT